MNDMIISADAPPDSMIHYTGIVVEYGEVVAKKQQIAMSLRSSQMYKSSNSGALRHGIVDCTY